MPVIAFLAYDDYFIYLVQENKVPFSDLIKTSLPDIEFVDKREGLNGRSVNLEAGYCVVCCKHLFLEISEMSLAL